MSTAASWRATSSTEVAAAIAILISVHWVARNSRDIAVRDRPQLEVRICRGSAASGSGEAGSVGELAVENRVRSDQLLLSRPGKGGVEQDGGLVDGSWALPGLVHGFERALDVDAAYVARVLRAE
jgi:hypothetical protein